MLDKKQIDLINQHLDDTNGEKEKTVLRRLFDKSSEARQFFQELSDLKEVFKEVKPVDPPAYLKRHIMNSLPRKKVHDVGPNRVRALVDALFSRARYRYVYAFAGGAAVGILLFAYFIGVPGTSDENVYGTIGPAEKTAPFDSEVVSPVDAAEAVGQIKTSYSPYTIMTEISLDSKNVEIVLSFDQSQLRFDTFRQENPTPGNVSIKEGELRWTGKGKNKYNIIFVNTSSGTPPLTARIFAANRLAYETTIVPTVKR